MEVDNAKLANHLALNRELTPDERFVALILAGMRNEKTLQCNPRQDKLALLAGKSRYSINRILRSLRKKEVIATIQQVGNIETPKRNTLQYYFTFDLHKAEAIAKAPSFQGNRDDLTCTLIKLFNSDSLTPKTGAPLHTKQVRSMCTEGQKTGDTMAPDNGLPPVQRSLKLW